MDYLANRTSQPIWTLLFRSWPSNQSSYPRFFFVHPTLDLLDRVHSVSCSIVAIKSLYWLQILAHLPKAHLSFQRALHHFPHFFFLLFSGSLAIPSPSPSATQIGMLANAFRRPNHASKNNSPHFGKRFVPITRPRQQPSNQRWLACCV